MTRGWLVGWSIFVGILWLAFAASFGTDETCSFICPTFSEWLVILVVPATVVWALGLIVSYIVRRWRRPTSPSDAGDTTNTD